MRKAKIVEIYSSLGEIVTTTVAEFVKEKDLDRSQLYKKTGALDADGTSWRVNEVPDITKSVADECQTFIFNTMVDKYKKDIATGTTNSGLSTVELRTAIKSWSAKLFFVGRDMADVEAI